uniref:Transmembrane 9 superfamily member n=1 Tax=Panthera leo TaxID=9689 RepID=A0A8C8WZV3_PANLE
MKVWSESLRLDKRDRLLYSFGMVFLSHQMYFMFGFLFLVFIILLITCSEAAVLLCYFYLCAEDYHWWWRAFFTSSFTAVYLLIYTVHYFFAKLQITGTASAILYFGYTMVMVLIFFLFTGNHRMTSLFHLYLPHVFKKRVYYFIFYFF